MGLFINSNLASLNMHKRLTELERNSEISTGLYALRDFIERGGEPNNPQNTIDTLTRLLPMLPSMQREYVIQELLTPLINQELTDNNEVLEQIEDFKEVLELKTAKSDYETEFRIKLRSAEDHSLKNPALLQYEHRKKEFKTKREEKSKELNAKRDKEFKKVRQEKLEASWNKLNLEGKSDHRKKILLKILMVSHQSYGIDDNPVLEKAKAMLEQLENT
jgi:hypothetical protein